jgi:hypothetical protein
VSRHARIFAVLFACLLGARLCHVRILWAEEALPLAAAAQMERGHELYRDIWFDKPPLLAEVYRMWGATAGWPLRLAGAIYALIACWLARLFAGKLWGPAEAFWALTLLAFFLIFDTPSAITPLAADLVMLAPHLAAVYLAWRGRAFWSGFLAGIAFAVNSKGLLVLAVCAIWSWRSLPMIVAGFAIPSLATAGWLWREHAWRDYYEQVWLWGRIYAARTFVEHPLRNALARSAGWLGFHAAVLIPALWQLLRERKDRWKWLAWLAISFASVAAGWRFFPRYFFAILLPLVLLGARGLVLMPRRARISLATAALLIPLVRFGPRYFLLARDLAQDTRSAWSDTAMDRDSREAAGLIRHLPQGSLFVWGFRPELYIYTRLPAANRFLDSQPLTGVPADRHLIDATPVAPELALVNRQELIRSRPDFVVDGLGAYNPALAIGAYPDLRQWLADYRPVVRTPMTTIYRRIP